MTEKTYKNENMIRTKHNVGRVIYFESRNERDRFMKLYKDIIYKQYISEFDKSIQLYITLPKKDFDDIVRAIGLINIIKLNHKTKFWRTEGAVV